MMHRVVPDRAPVAMVESIHLQAGKVIMLSHTRFYYCGHHAPPPYLDNL